MAKEIERKFLMNLNHWPKNEKGLLYEQGYLAITKKGITRVRIKEDKSTLTIKSKGTGLSRDEFEYQIPTEDAKKLLHLCKNDIISKTRYKVMSNKGMLIAEVEHESENEEIVLPKWVEKEVTYQKKYYNAYLSKYPFISWNDE